MKGSVDDPASFQYAMSRSPQEKGLFIINKKFCSYPLQINQYNHSKETELEVWEPMGS